MHKHIIGPHPVQAIVRNKVDISIDHPVFDIAVSARKALLAQRYAFRRDIDKDKSFCDRLEIFCPPAGARTNLQDLFALVHVFVEHIVKEDLQPLLGVLCFSRPLFSLLRPVVAVPNMAVVFDAA